MQLCWSQPPDDDSGSENQTEREMGWLVKGSHLTPPGEHSLGCSADDTADTDRRSLQVPSDRTRKKSRQRSTETANAT